MSTTLHDPQRANWPSVTGWVARHPVAAYLIMAFAFAWGGMLPLLLSESGFGVLPFTLPWQPFAAVLSIFGLALPAFLVTAATGGKAAVRDLLHRCLRWRVGVHWHLTALVGLLFATLLAAVAFLGAVPLEALGQTWPLLLTVYLPGVLVPFVLVNLFEETGWTGFLQATLQERHGPLLASLLVAPAFALMHLPPFFVAGWINEERTPLSQFPDALLQIGLTAVFAVFFRVLLMWLYNGSGRSVLIVALFHSAFNMTNGPKITPALLRLPESLASSIPLLVVAAAAVLLVAVTRGRLAHEPESASVDVANLVSAPLTRTEVLP